VNKKEPNQISCRIQKKLTGTYGWERKGLGQWGKGQGLFLSIDELERSKVCNGEGDKKKGENIEVEILTAKKKG